MSLIKPDASDASCQMYDYVAVFDNRSRVTSDAEIKIVA